MKQYFSLLALTVAAFAATSAYAAPVVYTPLASTPAGANLISATLTAQNNIFTREASARSAAIADEKANSVDATAQLITQQVEGNIASIISQSITNADGKSPDTGTFNLGGGQIISYNRVGGNTSVSIKQLGKQSIDLSFPNIQ